jgi:seryl-tRNA synthetase
MPIDINLLRVERGGDPEKVRESQRRRFANEELVDEVLALDEQWRTMNFDLTGLKKRRNELNKEIGSYRKRKEVEPEELMTEKKEVEERIGTLEVEVVEIKAELDSKVSQIGNLVDDSVVVSQDEEKDNEVVSTWGEPVTGPEYLSHHVLLEAIGGYEPQRGANVAGHRGYFLRDAGVLLNQALINYGIAFLRQRQYSILQPPFFMRQEIMGGVAQLEQYDEELYKVTGGPDDCYLIATSEQPICAFHMNELFDNPAEMLPLRYGGISTCFRKEAGSYGKDTWGTFRVHQFEKVEQFVICDGNIEDSSALHEEMRDTAEAFYQSLGIPYHVVNIVSGELNNAAIKKYDLEGWFPCQQSFRELVSASNCTDYQSRAMNIQCGGGENKKFVHMLNATLCATSRTMSCILENYQEFGADGKAIGVRIPEVLVPFMGGITFLDFVVSPDAVEERLEKLREKSSGGSKKKKKSKNT